MDELIGVANPSLWVTLCAIVILLAAVLGQSVFGAQPTTLSASAFSEGGTHDALYARGRVYTALVFNE